MTLQFATVAALAKLKQESELTDSELADAIDAVSKMEGPKGEKGDQGEKGDHGLRGRLGLGGRLGLTGLL